jgi:hypothetical protein
MFCELISLDRILYYIYKGSRFELRSSHLSTLRVKFLVTILLNQKNNINIKNVMIDVMTAEFKPPLFHVRVYNNFIASSI